MKRHEDSIGYGKLMRDALRTVVRNALCRVQEQGMPAEHAFYITFRTTDPNIVLPLYLRRLNPESMTVVLQYQFFNLRVEEVGFSVAMSFKGRLETLFIPFASISRFSDPSVQLLLNFPDDSMLDKATLPAEYGNRRLVENRSDESAASARRHKKKTAKDSKKDGGKVLTFRPKKTPPSTLQPSS